MWGDQPHPSFRRSFTTETYESIVEALYQLISDIYVGFQHALLSRHLFPSMLAVRSDVAEREVVALFEVPPACIEVDDVAASDLVFTEIDHRRAI